MDEQPLIFLSYASPDRERVFEYYDYLTARGFSPWMDKHHLKGGQNWDFEIKRALQKAVVIVVFLSRHSVDRRGYAQREIKMALDQSKDRLSDDIYIIPIMLEAAVPIPTELASIQVIRPEDGDQMAATAEAIQLQLERLGAESARIQGEADLRWTFTIHKDSWDGLPGYESSFQLPRLHSEIYPNIGEITDVVRGVLLEQMMAQRQGKYEQDPDILNFGQSRFRRQNSWEATCGDPKIRERVISMAYSVWWYGAGAAHPNHGFETFAFTLDPVTRIANLADIFDKPDEAFPVLQAAARDNLLRRDPDAAANDDRALDEEWVRNGTQDWDSFAQFVFGDEGIEILFGSYAVACYADGPQIANIPYGLLAPLMKKHFACALGIEYLQHDDEAVLFPAAEGEQDKESAR